MDAPDLLENLVERYARLVRASVARVAGRRDDDLGDEVVQRVSEALWKQLRAERHIEHPASYIYRCAVRETVKLLRTQAEHVSVEDTELEAQHASPEDALRAREVADATAAVIGELRPERAAAVRAHLAGLSVEEIMQLHGWRYNKARNLVARGMTQLRTLLVARGVS